MAARPFRFGVQQYQAPSASQWRDMARRTEALGYDILVIPDHIGGLVSYAPALMAAADATTVLRIGTFVLNNDFRHPALVAADAATLDLMSDGRFELDISARTTIARASPSILQGLALHGWRKALRSSSVFLPPIRQ
jgi:alkanesulfonate monooxygenase SsuD/methylene tetrahydromethanopterin reductase-like flavin-dependent oxidoreductase (luciferase family)